MTSAYYKKRFIPVPPEKGSFPLDHDGLCKQFMVKHMICLAENKKDNSACRQETRDYLNCRMENNLMAKEEWEQLGFSDKQNDSKLDQKVESKN